MYRDPERMPGDQVSAGDGAHRNGEPQVVASLQIIACNASQCSPVRVGAMMKCIFGSWNLLPRRFVARFEQKPILTDRPQFMTLTLSQITSQGDEYFA
jgi:hypothetical protein